MKALTVNTDAISCQGQNTERVTFPDIILIAGLNPEAKGNLSAGRVKLKTLVRPNLYADYGQIKPNNLLTLENLLRDLKGRLLK